MGLFGSSTKTCGHQSSSPFRARCTKDRGHTGAHSARGMSCGDDGKITFGAKASSKTARKTGGKTSGKGRR